MTLDGLTEPSQWQPGTNWKWSSVPLLQHRLYGWFAIIPTSSSHVRREHGMTMDPDNMPLSPMSITAATPWRWLLSWQSVMGRMIGSWGGSWTTSPIPLRTMAMMHRTGFVFGWKRSITPSKHSIMPGGQTSGAAPTAVSTRSICHNTDNGVRTSINGSITVVFVTMRPAHF